MLVFCRTEEFGYFKNLLKSVLSKNKMHLEAEDKMESKTIPPVDINGDGIADVPATIIEENNKKD